MHAQGRSGPSRCRQTLSGPPLALAVGGQIPEVLPKLLGGQLAQAVGSEHGLNAQVKSLHRALAGTWIHDHLVP